MASRVEVADVTLDPPPRSGTPLPPGELTDLGLVRSARHAVQFYEDAEHLARTVATFLGAGLDAGSPALVIARSERHVAIRRHLEERSVDVDRAVESGEITFLDADEVLAAFTVDDEPQWNLFARHVGDRIRQVRARHVERSLRAYGEMVDLLWARGKSRAAIRLEQMWNELARTEDFSLLCGYSLTSFASPNDAAGFEEVCGAHSHVHPAESCSAIEDDETRRREVGRLQQRTRALEAELRRRVVLEEELREQKEKLRAREEELRDFVENGVIGIQWVGPDGTILFANDAELALFGYSRKEYVGRQIRELHADEDVIEDILRRLHAGETVRDHEARLRCKDGTLKHVLITANVYWRDGKFVHTRCFTRDITVHKQAEEALRASQGQLNATLRHFAAVMDQMPAAVAIVEPDGKVLLANRQNEELLGAPVLATNVLAGVWRCVALHADGRPFTAGDWPIARSLLHGEVVQGEELHIVRPDGKHGYLRMSTSPVRDDDGSLIAGVAISEDITEQIRAQKKLEAIASELAIANRTKDEFLATVSHELRTPLNAILGWARMLQLPDLSSEKRARAIETIERNANAQTQLIEDLLDVSRIISGKLRLDVDTVDLRTVLENAMDAVRPAAQAKGVILRQTIDPDAGPILGDAGRLQQVAWNLLTNAVKFTSSGGTVSIAIRKRPSSVELIVTDDGQGIAPDFLPNVFERFRQADASPSRKQGGLGLGLAIVRHLVELHGGTVRVESEGVGRGAVFTVSLPTSPTRATSVERLPALSMVSPPSVAPPNELDGLRVLVVDDEPDVRELLSEMLATCSAQVVTAGSTAEALQLVQELRPDVIVSDIGMPREDGYVLIRKVRALPHARGGRTPAVALTAYTRFEDRTKALIAGFNLHVPKPVEPAELIAVLMSLTRVFPRQH